MSYEHRLCGGDRIRTWHQNVRLADFSGQLKIFSRFYHHFNIFSNISLSSSVKAVSAYVIFNDGLKFLMHAASIRSN